MIMTIRNTRNVRARAEKSENPRKLVILLHAFGSGPQALSLVRAVVQAQIPGADVFAPQLPLAKLSTKDPIALIVELLDEIDKRWKAQETGGRFDGVIIIGHSFGAVLARKLYVYACGPTKLAPFERPTHEREWAPKVERIILLAAINRGWSISCHMSLVRAALFSAGTIIGHLLLLFDRRLAIFNVRRGAPFLTNLRIQWLAMRKVAAAKQCGNALTIQLLGSIDDIVSPEDNVDLVSGRDFIYLDVPCSGHLSVIQMDDTPEGKGRQAVFAKALIAPLETLSSDGVVPEDLLREERLDVTDVIFVIHGIRDLGYWTSKVADQIQKLGAQRKAVYVKETSTYGYFPMLSFLLPWKRRAKVEWLMDQYAEDLALYPNADFSFVGHSNGTYLLAKALKEYPCCHFKHVVFAGSVVRTDYDWAAVLQEGRVQRVLNYVATADWVVALFPKVLQLLRFDVGSAGHDGFADTAATPQNWQVKFVPGGHAAALDERNWRSIAQFIVDGTPPAPPSYLIRPKRNGVLVFFGHISPLLWVLLLLVLVYIGACIVWPQCPPFRLTLQWPEWLRTCTLIIYILGLFKILTWL
jgi:pimeloyl-ACP methyl ester carboxylesterase